MPTTDKGPGAGDAKARILRWLNTWNDLLDQPETTQDLTWKKEKAQAESRIFSILGNHPALKQVAKRNGWDLGMPNATDPKDKDGKPDSDGDGIPDSADSKPNDPSNGDKKGDGKPGGGKKDDGGNQNNNGGDNHIVGKKGKDYQVVRFGGQTYIVYKVKVKGKTISAMWKVADKDLAGYGISKDEGRNLTKDQFKRLNYFGNYNDLKIQGNEHPFRAWVKRTTNLYEGFGFLKNKEVLSVMLEGWAEGWGADEIDRQVKLTKWFQNHKTYQLDWANLGKADQKDALNKTKFRLEESLEALFGSGWAQHVDKADLDKWALNIASGKNGNPDKAFTVWYGRQQNIAEGIEGTPAYVEQNEAAQGVINSEGNPAVMKDAILKQAQEWLGPQGIPDSETLNRWANQLANGKKSNVEWEDFLKRQKKALYAYLDENETWQDRASSFRSIAERDLGTTLNWDDNLFKSFVKTDAEGNPVGDGKVAMSAWDFQKAVRTDPRFNVSKTALDAYSNLTTELDQMFNATPY